MLVQPPSLAPPDRRKYGRRFNLKIDIGIALSVHFCSCCLYTDTKPLYIPHDLHGICKIRVAIIGNTRPAEVSLGDNSERTPWIGNFDTVVKQIGRAHV